MKKILPYLAIILSMLIWAGSGIAVKAALVVLTPMQLVVTRFLIAVVLMLIIGLCSGSLQGIQKGDRWLFLLAGFFQPFLYFILETYTYRCFATPTMAEAFLSTSPLIAPIFAPLGFDSWQAVAASITGFVAKEGIVSTIAIVSGLEEPEEVEEAKELWDATRALFPSVSAAFSFLVFNLMDSPCFAAIAAINREMNSKKWTFRALAFQNVYAYLLCLVIYQFGRVFVEGQGFNVWTGVAAVVVVFTIYLVLRPASNPMDLKAKETALANH